MLLILLMVNVLSIYVIKWFKVRYPDKINIANFSLLFKNIKNELIPASENVKNILYSKLAT